ncbi:hypothetical protein TRVL_07492 [Trypanosoma vivax]|nr:hypothetical protein TRVL_07492 [Trypanosoma vivax]
MATLADPMRWQPLTAQNSPRSGPRSAFYAMVVPVVLCSFVCEMLLPVSPMRFFALDESEAAKKQMLGRSSVNRSCLLAREPLCAASGRFIRRFFAFEVVV